MADPEVVLAIDDLVQRGVLSRMPAVRLRRAASGGLISVRDELRFLLWAGVTLIAAGAGLLVKANLERIGPLAIALVLAAVSVACLFWVWRRAHVFTWDETHPASFVSDYVLLLGALLAAADLAFVEVKFTALGAAWPWHLAIVAAAYAVLALRFDSRTLFSLALTSFAAWRGVSLRRLSDVWDAPDENRFLAEAIVCGLLFIALGEACQRFRRKAHFEPVATWLGWILIDGALLQRMIDVGSPVYSVAMAASGAVLAWFAWDDRKIGRFALGVGGVAAGIAGAGEKVLEAVAFDEAAYWLFLVVLAGGTLAIVHRAHAAMKARA